MIRMMDDNNDGNNDTSDGNGYVNSDDDYGGNADDDNDPDEGDGEYDDNADGGNDHEGKDLKEALVNNVISTNDEDARIVATLLMNANYDKDLFDDEEEEEEELDPATIKSRSAGLTITTRTILII